MTRRPSSSANDEVTLHGPEMLEYPWLYPGQEVTLHLADNRTTIRGTVIGTSEFNPAEYIVVRTVVRRADVLTATVTPGKWPPGGPTDLPLPERPL